MQIGERTDVGNRVGVDRRGAANRMHDFHRFVTHFIVVQVDPAGVERTE